MKSSVPPLVKVDLAFDRNKSISMLENCIPGAVPWQHTLLKGSSLTLEPGSFHHILQTVVGDAQFETDGNEYIFHERVCFIPHPDKPVVIKAITDLQILEIRWHKRLPEDDNLMADYKTQYPVIQIYRNSKQYRDRNKSEKTISRSTIDQRRIPRFAMGSVETYNIDAVCQEPRSPHAGSVLLLFPGEPDGCADRLCALPHGWVHAHVHSARVHPWSGYQGRRTLPLYVDRFLS